MELVLRTLTTVFSMAGQIPRADDVEKRQKKHSDVEVGDLAEATPELGGVPQHGVRRDDGRSFDSVL